LAATSISRKQRSAHFIAEPAAAYTDRQMGVRIARTLTIAAVALAAVTVSGSRASTGVAAPGVWAGCGSVALASAVLVRRIVLPHSGYRLLSMTQRHAAVVRKLFRDGRAVMAYPYVPPSGSSWECPADFGLRQEGVFHARRGKVAVIT
jgi:hypothetical protein